MHDLFLIRDAYRKLIESYSGSAGGMGAGANAPAPGGTLGTDHNFTTGQGGGVNDSRIGKQLSPLGGAVDAETIELSGHVVETNEIVEETENAYDILSATLNNSNMKDALPRIKHAMKLLKKGSEEYKILELVLTNSNIEDALPRIKQVLKMRK